MGGIGDKILVLDTQIKSEEGWVNVGLSTEGEIKSFENTNNSSDILELNKSGDAVNENE